MKTITKKGEIKHELSSCLAIFNSESPEKFVEILNSRILKAKVKFPLLEYCATEMYAAIPENRHIMICDRISSLRTIGGNVLLGILLQKRLQGHFEQSLDKAAEYMVAGEEWYVTDIIGERVYGWSLLNNPKKTLARFDQMRNHNSHWVVRAIGTGTHYAIKKGLDSKNAEQAFLLLLSLGTARHHHIKTGIGWAAKTTAKFHPDIIARYANQIEDKRMVGQWFRTKVKIGLKRGDYAKIH